jgi:hypothetical protein
MQSARYRLGPRIVYIDEVACWDVWRVEIVSGPEWENRRYVDYPRRYTVDKRSYKTLDEVKKFVKLYLT